MINKNKAERELLYAELSRIKKINRRLEDENRCLRENSEKIKEYRREYETLIDHMKNVEKKYKKHIALVADVEKAYQAELKKQQKKHIVVM